MRHGWRQDVRRRTSPISQLVDELQSMRGLKVDRRSVWEFLHAEGLSHKKNRRRTGARSQRRQAPA
jgi:transposase